MYFRILLAVLLFISSNVFGNFENHLKPVLNKSDIHTIRNIDFIYMINLDQRPEKLDQSLRQLHPYGIYPFRFSAVNGWDLSLEDINDVGVKFEPGMRSGLWGTSYVLQDGKLEPQHEIMHVPGKTYFCHCMGRGPIGINLSHLSILKDAFESGYQAIWVMEDDIEVIQDPRIISELIDKLNDLVGKNGWDILFTDVDTKNQAGNYVPCYGHAHLPNFTPADPGKFARRTDISSDFRQIGARYGAYSMIVRRSGMRKILNFVRKYSIFLPFDMMFCMPPGIRLYSLRYDVVSTLIKAISDNGAPPPTTK